MNETRNETTDEGRKMFVYSGHEFNIVSMLNVFGVFESHIPKYTSAVIIELFSRRDQYYVKVNSSTKENPQPICRNVYPLFWFYTDSVPFGNTSKNHGTSNPRMRKPLSV